MMRQRNRNLLKIVIPLTFACLIGYSIRTHNHLATVPWAMILFFWYK
jgi:hypothetical protein